MKFRRNIPFQNKKSRIEERVRQEYLDSGIATIPVKANDYYDIISSYSVEGHEALNPDFIDYIKDIADAIPVQYPIVIDIIGHFTKAERNTIKQIIREDFAYDLGTVEKKKAFYRNYFTLLLIGMIITGLLVGTGIFGGIREEISVILFWFCLWSTADYITTDGYDLRIEHIQAGRLACVEVTFSKEFDETPYTEDEVNKVFEELEDL